MPSSFTSHSSREGQESGSELLYTVLVFEITKQRHKRKLVWALGMDYELETTIRIGIGMIGG